MPETDSSLAKAMAFLVRYCTIVLAFLLPIFVIPAVWASVPQSKLLISVLLIVVALIAWLVQAVASRRLIFSTDPIILTSLLLPIAYALSAIFTQSSFTSFVSGTAVTGTVASMFLLFGACLIGAAAIEDRRHSFTAILALLISGALVFILQIARLFFPDSLTLWGALAGNTSSVVGSWHDLGIFTGLVLLIALGLSESFAAVHRGYATLMQVLAVMAFLLLIVINFADIWIGIAVAAILFTFARAQRSYRRENSLLGATRSAALWIILAVVCLGAGFSGNFVYSHLPAKLQITQLEVRPSWSGTFTAGQQLLQSGKSLIFGTGPNTFDQQWALFKPKEVNATNFWNTDFQSGIGVVPTALVTVGIIGTLGWLLLALALLWAGWKSFRDESEGRLRIILFIACGFLLAYHIIYVPTIGISILMFLLLGLLAGLNTSSWRVGLLSLSGQSILAFVLLLVITCGTIGAALVASRSVISTLLTSRAAEYYQRTGDVAATASMVSQAVQVDPQNDIAQRAAIEVGLLQFSKLASSGSADNATKDQLQKTLSSTIAHGLAAVSINSTDYQNWLSLAGLYQSLAGQGIPGAYEQAQTAWQRAASTTPSNPLPFLQLGQLAMAKGNATSAVGYFSQAITLKPDLALPYFLRSQIEAGQTNWQPAVNDAAAAAQLANQDPLGWYNLGVILYAAGDINNAGASLEKAVSLQNNYSDALFALAIVYDKVGAHDKAVQAMQKVLELNPGNSTATQILQNLQSGIPALGAQATSTAQTTSSGTKKKK